MKLLAPNGKPTNLTPEQYRLVRTPAFKAWFGDWENSPKTASKVIDENGEPLVVYHGSLKDFNVFDKYFINPNETDTIVNGFWFSSNKNTSPAWVDPIYIKSYFLNVRKDISWKRLYSLFNYNKDVENYIEKSIFTKNRELAQKKEFDGYFHIKPKIVNKKEFNKNGKYKKVGWEIKKDEDGGINYFADDSYITDYESIESFEKAHNETIIVVFEPNQIKLADGTNTTFDANNNDIRYKNGGLTMKAPKTKLLAPNGKPSNLTPEQYRLVRTPAFKAWFGDWENSPETASKVVDENGEPLVCYHGTNFEFNEFDYKKTQKNDVGFVGKGFYFTPKKSLALAYAERQHDREVWSNLGKKGKSKSKVIVKSFFLCIKKPKVISNPKDIGINYHLSEMNDKTEKEKIVKITNNLKKEGYNGVIWHRDNCNGCLEGRGYWEYVTFEPTQIKLADGTNTTFDSNNPDIRYAEGGSIPDLLSSQEVEQKLGRKLHWWNDDVVTINGANYKKVFLRPEYKIEEEFQYGIGGAIEPNFENMALFKYHNSFTLYNTVEKKVYGYIGINISEPNFNVKNGDNYYVGGVAAEYGYGHIMYELAMSCIYPKGLMPSRDGDIRSGAVNVWERFLKRKDVEKKRLTKKDADFSWIFYEDYGSGKEYGSHYVQTIFYYDGKKDLLNKLLIKAEEYILIEAKKEAKKIGWDIDKSIIGIKESKFLEIHKLGEEYWLDKY